MSAGSSARRGAQRAQGLFEPRYPARGTVCIPVRDGFTGRVKGPRVSMAVMVRPAGQVAPVAPEPAPRRTLAALARGMFRGVAARLNRARGGKD